MNIDIFGAGGVLAVIIPFVVNIVKKMFGANANKVAPVIAFVIGMVCGIIAHVTGLASDMSLIQAILAGVAVGGTSTGLYDLTKKLSGK